MRQQEFLKERGTTSSSQRVAKISSPIEALQEEIGYKQHLWLSPYESKSYIKVGKTDVGIKQEMYDKVLAKDTRLNKEYMKVRGMIIKVSLTVTGEHKQDRDAGLNELIDGKKFVTLNVLIDSGADGGILDQVTSEC